MAEEPSDQKFQRLAKFVENKATRPSMSTATKLELYGLWNQAMYGPNKKQQPSRLNFVDHAKWKAYKDCEKLDKEEAKKRFIAVVEKVLSAPKL